MNKPPQYTEVPRPSGMTDDTVVLIREVPSPDGNALEVIFHPKADLGNRDVANLIEQAFVNALRAYHKRLVAGRN